MARLRVDDIDVAFDIADHSAADVVPAGEPVLLVHGLGSCRHDWENQVRVLSRRYHVVAYDVRGHGDTSKPRGPYTMPRLAEDAAGLIRALGLGSVHLVGISMGAMIGFQLAVDHPELVRSLVVVNSGPEVVPRTIGERWQVWKRLVLLRLFGMRTVGKAIAWRLFPHRDQDDHRRRFVERCARNDKRAYLDSARAILGWSVLDRIGEVRCPTLVVSGDRDYTPVDAKRAYVERMHAASLVVVSDSGHATPIDQPQALNRHVLDFLSFVERRARTQVA